MSRIRADVNLLRVAARYYFRKSGGELHDGFDSYHPASFPLAQTPQSAGQDWALC